MKRTLLTILSVLFCAITFAQSVPQGINYQAVARDANGDVLMNQALTIQFSVISDITTSSVSWQETHTATTNDYGLFTAIIGQGTTTSVGSSATFDVIDWGSSNHLLKVEVDYGGGLVDMGTTAFMSVPYSLNADPTDELQSLSISGDTLFISSGNWIILPSSTPTLLGCTDPTSSTYNPLANTDDGSCCIDGCIDPLYLEYDASATCDDGSCLTLIVNGCTDATACNYNASANVDDGSCDIPNGCGDPLYLDYDTSVTCSDPNACLTLIVNGCMDSLACNYNASANVDDGSCLISYGCTDLTACNYDANATCDDGSCILPDGCTDSLANNYNPSATCDDGSCLYPPTNDDCATAEAIACGASAVGNNTGASANSPSPGAAIWYSVVGQGGDITVSTCGTGFDTRLYVFDACGGTIVAYNDDATCTPGTSSSTSTTTFTSVAGTVYSIAATGFNSSTATGAINISVSCAAPVPGCTDTAACNYNSAATVDDGSCLTAYGCTDPLACNYDANATCDDGTCLTAYGCTDTSACNYDTSATCDDGSCIGQVNGYCVFKPVDLAELKIAVNLWISDPTTAFLLYGPINSNWDLSLITSMDELFKNKTTFNDDISNWDVSNVQNMNSLFYSATSFDQDISNWDVSNVTDMYSMFYNATSFDQDISNWNVSSVTNMNYIFSYAEVFNKDISTWNVSSVTTMYEMFKRAYLFNQDISSWNVSSVTNMSEMFYETTSFNQDISSWNISPSSISQVTDMTYMFYNTLALSNLNRCLINNSFSPHPIWDPLYNTTPPPTYHEYFGMCSGCTDILACNYNPVYLNDDGTCLYGTLGCTDYLACNYDASAVCDDGSCIPTGCTDSTACNYNPLAGCDNGSCLTTYGCTDTSACNYDSLATCDNGGCTFYGCTDPNACNYDVFATCDDGSCLIAYGCTNTTASNYDPLATCDDGSCVGGVSIGDAHQGGIVIYIAPTPVDLNGDGNINLGLIAANEDQGTWKEWGCYGTSQGAWGTAIGTGAQNTNIIVSGCAQPHTAARKCNDYAGGGYTDWFLPSRDEAVEMFSQKAFLSNYTSYWYWTSTETSSTGANEVHSNSGSFSNSVKNNQYNVRAIRAF